MILLFTKIIFFKDVPICFFYLLKCFGNKYGVNGSIFSRFFGRPKHVLKNITIELLKPISERILATHDDSFLSELNRVWSDQKMCFLMIKDILLYMNKNYVPKTKLPPVEHMQTS